MPTTYVPLKSVKASLREVRDAALEQGRREGREEATRFVQWAAELNGSTHAVLKALQGEDDGTRAVDRGDPNRVRRGGVGRHDLDGTGRGEGMDGEPEGPEESVMLALLDASIEAKHHGSDGGPVVEYLQGLLDDPEALAATLAELDGGDVVEKASRFDETKHPRGDDGRFIGREQIHAAKSDPELAQKLRDKTTDPDERKKLDAAIGGETDLGRTQAGLHREKVATTRAERKKNLDRARELANDISTARRGGEPVPPEHFRELAALVPGMTIADLRSTREKLAASFGGQNPRREEMVRRIVEHAKNKAALLETNEKYEDMDALDFGSLHEYQNEGNAKGNERENPNPPEQHGGAMEQRNILDREHGVKDTVAYNARGADVKPYWKDEQGRPVDTITPKLAAADQKEIIEKPSVSGADATNPSNTPPASEPASVPPPITPEQAEARKWKKNDDGTYTAPNGVVWKKANAGGEVSPITGETFKGGRLMPVHGLSPKVDKKPSQGNGGANSVKPNEDSPKRQPPRAPMTPEQIEAERENRERQAKWNEMRAGVLGRLKHMTDSPMPLRNGTIDVDKWKAFADEVGEDKLKQIVDTFRKDRHAAVDADVIAQGQTNLDQDSIDWEKNSPERQAEIMPLSGKYRTKGAPSSGVARQHVQHALEDAKNPHDLHAIEKKLAGILSGSQPSPPSDATMSPAAPSTIPTDHTAALSKARTHHNRKTDTKGTPVPRHVVYRDAAGKVNATPSDSFMGKQLAAGKYPQYTVEGEYEFGADGKPVKVPTVNKAMPSLSWDGLRGELDVQDDAPPG